MPGRKLDSFTRAYLEAALWSTNDDDGDPLDRNYDIDDFAPEALDAAVRDTETFQDENEEDLDEVAEEFGPPRGDWTMDEQNGHDFWLTRNGHGVGFWGRGYGAVGDRLSAAAEAFGEVDIYVTDDGRLYFFGE